VYPTAEFEETFHTRQPRIFAGVVISGFALLFGIFLLYDCIMQRYQRMLKESAVQSDAIVSSLFPQTVKQQLYDNYNNDNASLTDMGDSHSLPDDAASLNNSYIPQGPPIAEYYPSSTILFADIAGFTKWSSSRAPADVFEFLERLYGGFDQAAMSHGVFKIETIGDCYVAAAGIPESRPDHAVIMVKFANAMLEIIQEVLQELGERLQANKLALRVGIHSGPVTAGVLRGEKARFQLFGDTVNTTARHESGGKPGKIHISKETAALIQEAGHDNWIKPRRDKVYMKGKGYNETYWVIPNNNNNNATETGRSGGGCTGGGGGTPDWDCGVMDFCQN
jgi:class 3 adenylate cyclase